MTKVSFSIIPPMAVPKPWRMPSPKVRAKRVPPSISSASQNWYRQMLQKRRNTSSTSLLPSGRSRTWSNYDAVIVGTGTRFGRTAS